MKGVQLFNKRMLSRWRTEGFLDFAMTGPASATASSFSGTFPFGSSTPVQGQAAEILQKLLARSSDDCPAGRESRRPGSVEAKEISLDRRLLNEEDDDRVGGGEGVTQGSPLVQQTAVPWPLPDPLVA